MCKTKDEILVPANVMPRVEIEEPDTIEPDTIEQPDMSDHIKSILEHNLDIQLLIWGSGLEKATTACTQAQATFNRLGVSSASLQNVVDAAFKNEDVTELTQVIEELHRIAEKAPQSRSPEEHEVIKAGAAIHTCIRVIRLRSLAKDMLQKTKDARHNFLQIN